MTSRYVPPFADVGSGIKPSSGAQLFFFETGTNTPKDTYSDSDGLTPNTNPVIADASGVFSDIFIIGTYKVILQDKNNVQIWEADPVSEYALIEDSAFVKNFASLSDAAEDPNIQEGDDLNIKERTVGNAGGGVWDVVLTSSVTPNTYNIVESVGIPTLSLVLRIESIIDVRQFGEPSDDGAMQAALDFGGNILFSTNTYTFENLMNVPENTVLDLDGSTVNFNLTTQIPGFSAQGDNIEIHGGAINVIGTLMGGSGNSLNCIASGTQATGAGFKNLHFHDLTVSTNRNDAGASIGLLGECTNFIIENITVPDNADCRNVIGCEWGGTPEDGTGHPHNGVIRNIKGGKLTFPTSGAGGFGFLVWLSAAFNIDVSNLDLEEGFGLMMAIAGDNGNTYAPAEYKELIGTGITLDNAGVAQCFGYGVRAIGKSDGTVDESISVTNLKVIKRDGEVGNIFGMQTEFSKNAKLNGFEFDGCLYSTGSTAVTPSIENGEIRNSPIFGMGLGSGAGECVAPKVKNVHFKLNNANAGAGTGTAALTLSNVSDPDISGCTFGDVGVTETQKYSISGTVDTKRPKINNNHTNELLAGGVSYIFGASSQTEIEAQGVNNTSESGITNTSGSPIFQIDGFGNRSFAFTITPVVGTYKVGDKVYFVTPSAGGFIGSVNVVAGSPGTWKNFGAIVA